MSSEPQIFSLKQVVSSIRKTIEERYRSTYWVKAEMHKLNRFPSGHCFPELLQKENGKIVAQVSGSIWKHNFERINERFVRVVKEPLKEDTTLLMQVKISFHETYGLSLQILDIDPNYVLGELQREKQETIKKLQKENIYDANQQLPFPLLPKRIAVISAASSKGLSDFMKVLDENEWNYSFFTMLFPAYLQGDQAAESIIGQLEQIRKVRDHFDLVVIVRGGGGEVGMSCYNNYSLCRAIATYPLPVLTGIGHSTNQTVAEMISYRNAITPTELGEFLLQSFHNFSVPLKDAVKSLKYYSRTILDFNRSRLERTTQTFKHTTEQRLTKTGHELLKKGGELKNKVQFRLKRFSQELNLLEHKSFSESTAFLRHSDNRVHALAKEIPLHIKAVFVKEQNNLSRIEQSVRLMDPINVLKRGYSITTFNGKTINQGNQVSPGDQITTRTTNFIIESEVIEKKKSDE